MRLEFKIIVDKNNEAEVCYGNMLAMSFASYNMLSSLGTDLPEISSEICDCSDTVEYRLRCNQELTQEDIQKMLETVTL